MVAPTRQEDKKNIRNNKDLSLSAEGGGDFDCLVSGEEKGVVGLVGLEPTISPL